MKYRLDGERFGTRQRGVPMRRDIEHRKELEDEERFVDINYGS
jgi:hypothetical protein